MTWWTDLEVDLTLLHGGNLSLVEYLALSIAILNPLLALNHMARRQIGLLSGGRWRRGLLIQRLRRNLRSNLGRSRRYHGLGGSV
jgi:hypothetical protein